ncbi:hypothetical protein GALL_419190 [mine drainage metagenome]|uniref:Uncharacterized protein n=1 Tax=mine drainage metagenome TaxID=410659 RepID=A0A1J5PZA8_9ZZZZ
MTTRAFAHLGHKLFHARHVRLVPIPLEYPGADARFRRKTQQHFQLLLCASKVELLVQTELHRLFQRVHRVIACLQEDDDVRVRRLRLDEVRREIGGAKRGQIAADLHAAKFRRRRFQTCLKRVAEGVVGRQIIPLLTRVLDERGGHRTRLGLRRVADAEGVPVAVLASNRVGMAARNNVEHALFVRDVGNCLRQRRVDVADDEIDLIAVDQFARLLHGGAGVARGRVLDGKLDLLAQNAALGVDLIHSHRHAQSFVLAKRRIGAGQGVVHANLDDVSSTRSAHEGRDKLGRADNSTGLDQRPPIKLGRASVVCHLVLT